MTEALNPHVSAITAAYLEILCLRAHEDLALYLPLSSYELTPREQEERRARLAALRRRELEILKKHGVIDQYLDPLRERNARLEAELAEVKRSIVEFEDLLDDKQEKLF